MFSQIGKSVIAEISNNVIYIYNQFVLIVRVFNNSYSPA